jgi:hypothetical protein
MVSAAGADLSRRPVDRAVRRRCPTDPPALRCRPTERDLFDLGQKPSGVFAIVQPECQFGPVDHRLHPLGGRRVGVPDQAAVEHLDRRRLVAVTIPLPGRAHQDPGQA